MRTREGSIHILILVDEKFRGAEDFSCSAEDCFGRLGDGAYFQEMVGGRLADWFDDSESFGESFVSGEESLAAFGEMEYE